MNLRPTASLLSRMRFAHHDEAPFPGPALQPGAKFAHRVMFIHRLPVRRAAARCLSWVVKRATTRYGKARASRKLNRASSKKPLSARTHRIVTPAGSKANASERKATAPRAAPVLPLRNHPCNTKGASASTARSG